MVEGSTAAVEKAPGAFRTISEVAQELEVPQHVLRFWESRFREIRPMKRGGGRRYYRPDDLDLLRGIRHLLYGEGYTIRGVQRLLREQGVHFVQNVWQPGAPQPARQAAEQDEDVERASLEDADVLPLASAGDGVGNERVQSSRSQPAAGGTGAAAAGLAAEEVQKLHAALHDLAECRRLLEAALREKI
jgi:DNA-binding transcriptional MerR regulator